MATACQRSEADPGRRPAFLFNPYEIAVSGFSASALAEFPFRLAREAFRDWDAAIVVQASLPAQAGCLHHKREVSTADEPRDHVSAEIGDDIRRLAYPARLDGYLTPRPVLDADFALILRDEDCDTPKIVCAEALNRSAYTWPIAYVGVEKAPLYVPPGAPYFHCWDQMEEIKQCVVEHLTAQARALPLYGLVLAGGLSTRMKRDKAGVSYHGKPQVEYCHELLSAYCERVFVSNRAEQSSETAQRALPQIHDTFLGIGPMGGILSALKAYPRAAWLVLACDLPFVGAEALEKLIAGRNPFKLATAYKSHRDGLPEPLCAIYEPKSVFRLLHFLGYGCHCPRKVLRDSDTRILDQPNAYAMVNVNSPDEYEEALRALRQEGKALT